MNKPLLGTLTVGLVLVILSVSPMISTNVTNPSEEGLKYSSSVCVEKNGELISCSPNTITNVGKNMIQDMLTAPGTQTTEIKYIALCNNTNQSDDGGALACNQTKQTDTVLLAEYFACNLERGTATLSFDTSRGNISYANTFTSTCDNVTTNVTALFNSSSSGTTGSYFAGNNFTAVTLETDDQLTVTWYIWVT